MTAPADWPPILVRKDGPGPLPWSIRWVDSEGLSQIARTTTGEIALRRVRRIVFEQVKRARQGVAA